jgi:hypothetical protein
MAKDPLTSPPVEVELVSFGLDESNNVWVRLRFADGAEWDLEWAPDAPEVGEILDLFTQLTTELIARVGGRGVTITGVTPLEEEEAEE